MMDNLSIQAAEAAVHANYPDCGGLLLVELDGPIAEVAANAVGENGTHASNGTSICVEPEFSTTVVVVKS